MKKIKIKFDFGELVTPYLGDKVYRVVSMQVNMDRSIVYGCTDDEGKWEWFKDFEIMRCVPKRKIEGFIIEEDESVH